MPIFQGPLTQKIAGIGFRNPNLWEFYFDDDPDLRFLVKSTTLPFYTLETEIRDVGTKHYTDFAAEEEFSITFNETKDFEVYEYLKDWLESIYDRHTKKFKKGRHYKDAILAFQNFTGGALAGLIVGRELEYVKAFKFDGLLIKKIEDWELGYEGVEGTTITATFTVHRVYEISPKAIREA
jgi:hypothetical protein